MLQHIKNSGEGFHPHPPYHGGGMNLRLRPRVNLALHLSPIPRDLKDLGLRGKKWLATPRDWLGTRFQKFFSPIHRISVGETNFVILWIKIYVV